jgi:hypothetical protein
LVRCATAARGAPEARHATRKPGAVMFLAGGDGLRWFRDRTTADALARDHGVSRATAYRYLDEVILVLAQQAPDLRRMLERAKGEGFSHVILDGKIIAYDRCKEPTVTSPATANRRYTWASHQRR